MKIECKSRTLLLIIAVLIVTCGCVLQTPVQVPRDSMSKNITMPISPGATSLTLQRNLPAPPSGRQPAQVVFGSTLMRVPVRITRM